MMSDWKTEILGATLGGIVMAVIAVCWWNLG